MTLAVILAMLRTKYANLGLSEKTLGGLAKQILEKQGVTTETLEAEVDAIEPFVNFIRTDGDERVSKALKTATEKGKEKQKDPKDAGADSGNDDPNKSKETGDVPEWAKVLIESNKSLASELTAFKQGKTTETRREIYSKTLEGLSDTLKKSMLAKFDRMSFKDDADFEAFNTEETATAETLRSETVATQLDGFGRTIKTNGNQGAEKVSSAMTNVIAQRTSAKDGMVGKDPFS